MYKTIPIFLPGDQIAYITAGPTREMPDTHQLVRCAAEIKVDPERVAFDVSTGDFEPFDDKKIAANLPRIINHLITPGLAPLYVGCMGGTGRTGTLLAILAAQHPKMDGEAAVAYIRAIYKPHAVETFEQKNQVAEWAVNVPNIQEEREDERAYYAKRPMDVSSEDAEWYAGGIAGPDETGGFAKLHRFGVWVGEVFQRAFNALKFTKK